MPLDALATGPSRFSADAGVHGTSIKAAHNTSRENTIPSDLDPCRKTLPLPHLDSILEPAPTICVPKSCQTIDAAAVAGTGGTLWDRSDSRRQRCARR